MMILEGREEIEAEARKIRRKRSIRAREVEVATEVTVVKVASASRIHASSPDTRTRNEMIVFIISKREISRA